MHFPRFRDDHPYVLIVRGDGFPCGARSWCQIACGFANHMQKARTLLYNWTLDLALVSEHETDLVRVLFGERLKKIKQIIDRGYMLLREFWVRTVVIIGGDSPWLRHILGLSTFYEIRSIYSFATWSGEKERWVGCEWRRSTRLEAKFLKYRKQGVSCVGAKGCIESPLLKVDDRIGCVIMCVLHLVIRCCEYLTTFVRTRATMLTVPQRSKVQSLLKDAKTNVSLKGRSFPDALAVVHGVGDHPMLVHTHPKDDSPLTGEIALGDFVGGGLFTRALLCANGPSRPAWIRWGRDLLWGHIVDPRYGVMFNALRPHMPLAWSGQRIVLVPYTGIAWGRLPVAMQNQLVTFGFPR